MTQTADRPALACHWYSDQTGKLVCSWEITGSFMGCPLYWSDDQAAKNTDCRMWERRAYDEGLTRVAEVLRGDRGLPGSLEPVPQIPALIERGRGRVRRFYRKLDGQLKENRFVASDGTGGYWPEPTAALTKGNTERRSPYAAKRPATQPASGN